MFAETGDGAFDNIAGPEKTVPEVAIARGRSGGDEIAGVKVDPLGQIFDLAEIPDISAGFIVICTQGKRDREALAAALATDADYVAFVGSTKKSAALKDQLGIQAIARARLARLRSPAGLDIGAVGPEEIALSVLAEIVQFRRRARARQSAPEAARK